VITQYNIKPLKFIESRFSFEKDSPFLLKREPNLWEAISGGHPSRTALMEDAAKRKSDQWSLGLAGGLPRPTKTKLVSFFAGISSSDQCTDLKRRG